MSNITLASFNLYGLDLQPRRIRHRYAAMADYFNTSTVDIINVQEVFTYPNFFMLKSMLHTYPHSVYHPSFIGPRGGTVTFSKLPIQKTAFIGYKKRHVPFGFSYLEMLTRKGILISRLSDYNITIINTHFSPVLSGDWSKKSRYFKQLHSEISQFHHILKIFSGEEPIIASGDFNIAKNSDLYSELLKLDSLEDVFKSDTTPTIFQTVFEPKVTEQVCIDYIFLFNSKGKIRAIEKKQILTETFLIDRKEYYISDHIGLQVTLRSI